MSLPITLLCAEARDPQGAQRLLESQAKLLDFQEVVLVCTGLPPQVPPWMKVYQTPLLNRVIYQELMLHLHRMVSSEFVLVVQLDGYIRNPDLWSEEFLQYDYIGAPWPDDDLWIESQSAQTRQYYLANEKKCRIGNGGFSLRSRKFLEYSSKIRSTWGCAEDAVLCVHNYPAALRFGIRFPSVETAMRFSVEDPIRELGCRWPEVSEMWMKHRSFGFHRSQVAPAPG